MSAIHNSCALPSCETRPGLNFGQPDYLTRRSESDVRRSTCSGFDSRSTSPVTLPFETIIAWRQSTTSCRPHLVELGHQVEARQRHGKAFRAGRLRTSPLDQWCAASNEAISLDLVAVVFGGSSTALVSDIKYS